MALITSILTPNGANLPVASNQQLADMFRTLALSPALSTQAEAATLAAYTWTTAKVLSIIYAAGTCTLTLPDESAAGLIAWPVGEVRSLIKSNTSVNVISFAALTNVSFNLAAVNTAIATLIDSAVVPGIATGMPTWKVYRASATLYLVWQGV